MDKNIIKFLSRIEGFKTRVKGIHWVESSIPGHELAGDVEKELQSFEDSLAEDLQGVYGVDISSKELKPIDASSSTLKKLIEEILTETLNFYKTLKGDKFIGARSEIEGFIHIMNVKKYLCRKTLNEVKNTNKGVVNECRLRNIIDSIITEEIQKIKK